MIDKSSFHIVLIGAGNLATHLGKALCARGFRVGQVYSRTYESAASLAEMLSASPLTAVDELPTDADLYIVSLTDAAFVQLLPRLTAGREDRLFVHTAGSIPLSVWQGHGHRYGVFYPMQTFSKRRDVNFEEIPLFIEANNDEDLQLLSELGGELSHNVRQLSSEQRKILHLAAVFACNFTNHMYTLANKLLAANGISFDAMLPLIDETARKVHQLPPAEAQTGPAVRYDHNVIAKHLDLLTDMPDVRALYQEISKSIHKESTNE